MWKYLLIGGGVYLLMRNQSGSGASETQIDFPKIEGGKNLAFDKLPVNEFGLPVAIHVYKIDFPLQLGDKGNVIAVLQQMFNARNYGFQVDVTGEYDIATRTALMHTSYTLDDFILLATANPPIVAKVEVYDYKPGVK